MKYLLAFLLLSSGFAIPEAHAEQKQQTYNLMLYYSPTCPHCKKVISYLKSNGIQVPMKNADGDGEVQQELIDVGGYSVVPCLVVNGKAIYNADNIIDWFSSHQQYLSK